MQISQGFWSQIAISNEVYYINATHGQYRSVATNERTVDQIFAKITSGTLCINFSSLSLPLLSR